MSASEPPLSGPQRFIAAIRGDAEGTPGRRILFYAFRLVVGGIVGFLIMAMAASPRGSGAAQHFPLEFYLYGIAAGALAALAISLWPRLTRPRDWPTQDEFRRGAPPERDQR